MPISRKRHDEGSGECRVICVLVMRLTLAFGVGVNV